MRRAELLAAVALVVSATAIATAQIGGKFVSGGNPTPGTEQPAPPNVADRITLTGCMRPAPTPPGVPQTPDANTPTNSRFVLANATRVDRVPADTGGSPLATAASGATYRLEGIESQFSPFVDTKVEISGEVKPSDANAPTISPMLLVEFVQKIAATCK
jgi:hypothetical protein